MSTSETVSAGNQPIVTVKRVVAAAEGDSPEGIPVVLDYFSPSGIWLLTELFKSSRKTGREIMEEVQKIIDDGTAPGLDEGFVGAVVATVHDLGEIKMIFVKCSISPS